jgi:hypothetical protein
MSKEIVLNNLCYELYRPVTTVYKHKYQKSGNFSSSCLLLKTLCFGDKIMNPCTTHRRHLKAETGSSLRKFAVKIKDLTMYNMFATPCSVVTTVPMKDIDSVAFSPHANNTE